MPIVAISADGHEESAIFANEGRIRFPLLRDEEVRVATAYGVGMKGYDIAIPSTFIIDQQGLIHWKTVGETMADRADFDAILAVLDGM